MLMMLGVGAACGKQEAQLMLMMPGVGAACGKNAVRGRGARLVGKRGRS